MYTCACNIFGCIQVASSLGALVLFRALLVLADSDKPVEPLIDSVILISLPQVVSPREWAKVRKVTTVVSLLDAHFNLYVEVVGRRIVNAYSSRDFVLAGVGRLHEVVSGAGFGGMAGLNAVEMHGVEDIDVSELVGGKQTTQRRQAVSSIELMVSISAGHFDINANMEKVLQTVRVNE